MNLGRYLVEYLILEGKNQFRIELKWLLEIASKYSTEDISEHELKNIKGLYSGSLLDPSSIHCVYSALDSILSAKYDELIYTHVSREHIDTFSISNLRVSDHSVMEDIIYEFIQDNGTGGFYDGVVEYNDRMYKFGYNYK